MINVLLILTIIFLVILLGFVIKLYSDYHHLNNSLAKLGYVIREDMKNLWASVEEKYVQIQNSYSMQNQEIIKKAIAEILKDQQAIHNQIYLEAQAKGQQIVNEARQQAEGIQSQLVIDQKKMLSNTLEKSASIIENVLKVYIGENFNIENHEEIIKKLFSNFIEDES